MDKSRKDFIRSQVNGFIDQNLFDEDPIGRFLEEMLTMGAITKDEWGEADAFIDFDIKVYWCNEPEDV